ncbi:MAG TPA: endolytic transglycosylase MltG, partial [Candidatus Paceibacterota bacterium]|nr:endolytic transglycosylase MltG [Candidatus Paceibacterota bacterium]
MSDLRSHKVVIVITAIAVAVIGIGLFVAWAFGPAQAGSAASVQFTVQPGWGGGRIASELQRAGLIRWTWAFIIEENLTHTGDRLQAGTYLLSPGMTPAEIERIIATGAALSTDITVTIPEGMNVWEIDRLLLAQDIIGRAGQFSSAYGDREGMLFPDTYRVPASASADIVADRLTAEFDARAGTYTKTQVVIASILEKEAKTPADMALVAGIIESRIAKGMPLQIDATVAYGWCVRTKGFAKYCDVTQAPVAS